ncbi:MAG: amino acid permease [Streptococcaceae bacterium]|nr:amino acid permease [Streptococcaceae bacterium]
MEEKKLKKTIGFFPALTTTMGTVIGAGVFFKAATVASVTGTASLQLFAWLLAGIITIAGGLTAAELAAAIPETGGMVRYMERAYGKIAAFFLGWAQAIVYFPAFIAALAIIFASQVVILFAWPNSFTVPIAILAVALVTFVNLLGTKVGGMLQSVTFILKLIPISLIVIFGLLRRSPVHVQLLPLSTASHLSFFSALGAALLATMFAYDGWIYAGNIAGEMKNPTKDLPRAIIFGLAAVMLIYLAINFTFIKTLGISELMKNTGSEPINAAKLIFGDFGGKLVTVGILVSVFGALNGFSLTGMRVSFVMAEDKIFFSRFRKISARTAVPTNSGLLQMSIAIIMLGLSLFSTNAFNSLTDLTIFVIWIFYALMFIAVFVLRKKEPTLTRPYKVPLYPVIPIIAVIGAVFILMMTLIEQFNIAMLGIIVTATGYPFYRYFVKKYK